MRHPAIGRVCLRNVDEVVVDTVRKFACGVIHLIQRFDKRRSRAGSKVEDGRPSRIKVSMQGGGLSGECHCSTIWSGAANGYFTAEAGRPLVKQLILGRRQLSDARHRK